MKDFDEDRSSRYQRTVNYVIGFVTIITILTLVVGCSSDAGQLIVVRF